MRSFGVSVVALYIAGVLEFGVAGKVMIFGAKPDYLLVVVAVLGLMNHRGGATACGALGGLLKGAIVGANMMHYIVTRTLAGFIVAWSRNLRLDIRIPHAMAITGLATILTQIIFLFLAAPPNLLSFMLDTIRTAVYNSLLAAIFYPAILWAMGPTTQRTRYERNL